MLRGLSLIFAEIKLEIMKKQITLFLLLGIFQAQAQSNNTIRCGSDNYYEQHLHDHPEVVQERNELELYIQNFQSTWSDKSNASITIPVVFHVNDPVNPQKVTLEQIQSALSILNDDFTANNYDINSIRPEFQSIIADMDINFCLASKDPYGQPTSGVTYHINGYNGREPNGYGAAVKSVSYWPGDQYLNIWIVNYTEDDGSLYNSGWAFLPDNWIANNNLDGIVYNHRYLGYAGSSEVSGPSSWQAEMARVLTHEVGHYLNLYHTFENYCASPGDYVDDTPYVYYHGSNNCEQLGTFCSGTSVVQDQNYMDYTPCPSMFSSGQKTRVHASLNSTVAGRSNLWTTENLIATGCMSPGNSGMDELESYFQVSPNPVGDRFQILGVKAGSLVQVFDSKGVEVMVETLYEQERVECDVNSLQNGLYLVRISTGEYSETIKLVKN